MLCNTKTQTQSPLVALEDQEQQINKNRQQEGTESAVGDQLKTCFKCLLIKPISHFYKHSEMHDGHLGKCISCTKIDSRLHGKKSSTIERRVELQKLYREKYRNKFRARGKTQRAVLAGKIKRKPCEICGNIKSEAHHPDYDTPLNVKWLCMKHHRLEHGTLVGEIE